MKCPKCGSDLRQVEKYDIIIDYCPNCGTVVLDKGEIEKILQAYRDEINGIRMNNNVPFSSSPTSQNHHYYNDDDDDHESYRQNYQGNQQYPHNHPPHQKKKDGFLDDIFDFDIF
ncbi:MAG: zf-TFIIB domain-containing protein [Candidatus Dojkabacteria bacterium]|nr:zf-TFIIB domain-containing protein [Candidatus Dojkabacteria bacterium]